MSKTAYESFMTDVASAIRARREAAGMTLEDLAYQAEMTSRHLFEIEKARSNPTLKTLFKLASALNIRVRDLFDDVERRPRIARK